MNLTKRWEELTAPRLCFIQHGYAYFTTLQDVTQQWGDDWGDVPYEHNAGSPYKWRVTQADVTKPYKISKFPFRCDHLVEPKDLLRLTNSPYSVEMINSGNVAWLQSPTGSNYDGRRIEIMAGVTFDNFVKTVHSVGGQVYIPIPKEEHYELS